MSCMSVSLFTAHGHIRDFKLQMYHVIRKLATGSISGSGLGVQTMHHTPAHNMKPWIYVKVILTGRNGSQDGPGPISITVRTVWSRTVIDQNTFFSDCISFIRWSFWYLIICLQRHTPLYLPTGQNVSPVEDWHVRLSQTGALAPGMFGVSDNCFSTLDQDKDCLYVCVIFP